MGNNRAPGGTGPFPLRSKRRNNQLPIPGQNAARPTIPGTKVRIVADKVTPHINKVRGQFG
jgi:hypothetical protein